MFHVGQRVVCVDDKPPSDIPGPLTLLPVRGHVYTISAVGLKHPNDPQKLPCVQVRELARLPTEPIWAHRFRPLDERQIDITIFQEIARKVQHNEPVGV